MSLLVQRMMLGQHLLILAAMSLRQGYEAAMAVAAALKDMTDT
ncbi:hypothetical protein PS691_02514 [Pseudomonas fluorescens]|uniref:Uncharacterized protein n=1 Tax=Pseudomonas fluorescens TaxID=294 RepID=A0A5E7CHP9_PSEFL|nr:hypothetical protein PS691_02514 [Pseudomonas fluorescens]